MKRLRRIEGDQLANATRLEVFDELIPEAPAITLQPPYKALKKRALYKVRKKP